MCIAGDVNLKVETLKNSHQSMESRTTLVEDKVHLLQGDYKIEMRKIVLEGCVFSCFLTQLFMSLNTE